MHKKILYNRAHKHAHLVDEYYKILDKRLTENILIDHFSHSNEKYELKLDECLFLNYELEMKAFKEAVEKFFNREGMECFSYTLHTNNMYVYFHETPKTEKQTSGIIFIADQALDGKAVPYWLHKNTMLC